MIEHGAPGVVFRGGLGLHTSPAHPANQTTVKSEAHGIMSLLLHMVCVLQTDFARRYKLVTQPPRQHRPIDSKCIQPEKPYYRWQVGLC